MKSIPIEKMNKWRLKVELYNALNKCALLEMLLEQKKKDEK
jgi:hypothetical protein